MKTRIPESIILAIAIVAFGVLVYFGIDKASDRGRVVHVRGLAEMEVPADKVFWNISYGLLGNDMKELFKEIAKNNNTIKQFLVDNGIAAEDITFMTRLGCRNDAFCTGKEHTGIEGFQLRNVDSRHQSVLQLT